MIARMLTLPMPRPLGSALSAAGMLVAFAVATGCTSSPPPPAAKPEADAETSAEAVGERCDEMLSNALTMLHPRNVGISSDREDGISLLNTWLHCGLDETAPLPELDDQARAALDPLLDDETMSRAEGARFSVRDGSHLTEAILLHAIADSASSPNDGPLDRAIALFEYMGLNLARVDGEPIDFPRTPYITLMLGQGSPSDRAWLFAELLRQLQIDTVLLRTASDDDPAAALPLVGALIDGSVYLFDPYLGLPIPPPGADEDALTPARPATLAEASDDDALFRTLDRGADSPYPWTAEKLKEARVSLIANTSLWSPAMKRLQASMTGSRSAVVYEEPADTAVGPGFRKRIAANSGAGWTEEQLDLWAYPEQQAEQLEVMTEQQATTLGFLLSPLRAPFEIKVEQIYEKDEQGQVVVDEQGNPKVIDLKIHLIDNNRLRVARIQHLMGDYTAAGSGYLDVRLHSGFDPQLAPFFLPEQRYQVGRAMEDSFFWGAQVKFQQKEFGVAADILQDYLRRFPPGSSSWPEASRYLLALSLARDGKPEDAVKTLEGAPVEFPLSEREQLLLEALR